MVRLLLLSIAVTVMAQDPPPAVKALDQEISNLKRLPDDARARKVKELGSRIRQQQKPFGVSLAVNLMNAGSDGSGRETLQEIASTLAETLRKAPVQSEEDDVYFVLAELVRYNHLTVALDSPRYRTAMAQIDVKDRERAKADFSLTDVAGKSWSLRSLRGSVVLANFWDSWCEPCRRAIPDLSELHKRFEKQGLVVLALLGEDPASLKRFAQERSIPFPLLVDSGTKVRQLYSMGVPRTLVFDREGKLVAQAVARPARSGWLEMLERAGLR